MSERLVTDPQEIQLILAEHPEIQTAYEQAVEIQLARHAHWHRDRARRRMMVSLAGSIALVDGLVSYLLSGELTWLQPATLVVALVCCALARYWR